MATQQKTRNPVRNAGMILMAAPVHVGPYLAANTFHQLIASSSTKSHATTVRASPVTETANVRALLTMPSPFATDVRDY
jgi:hypothetical protein